MQRYRCPKCGYTFYGKISKCFRCHVNFRYPGDQLPEEKKIEKVKEEVPENKEEQEISDELISSLVDELHSDNQ